MSGILFMYMYTDQLQYFNGNGKVNTKTTTAETTITSQMRSKRAVLPMTPSCQNIIAVQGGQCFLLVRLKFDLHYAINVETTLRVHYLNKLHTYMLRIPEHDVIS